MLYYWGGDLIKEMPEPEQYQFIVPFLFKMTPGLLEMIRTYDKEFMEYFEKLIIKNDARIHLLWPFNEIGDVDVRCQMFEEVTLQNLARDAIREAVWKKVKIGHEETEFHRNLELIEAPRVIIDIMNLKTI